ncbi:MAG: nicotinamide mononucleotide transporter [Bacteroidales bacterium]|nr:nicotinamide mononucleotide transporter [Bacteroidales bacterium]MBO7567900.1 nicotinamide mononucleotide transporter [Bacteroidales bacterium]MBP5682130.1 nicotinamide mononucleotide transporter [Bacteroidales bacterium]
MIDYITENWLEIVGTLIGIIYLWQEVKASIWLWLTGIVMPAIYTVVFFQNGLYADFGIQVYYIIAAVYGFLLWKFGKKNQNGNELRIVHTTASQAVVLCAITAVLFLPIYWILTRYTDSNVPFFDSLTTAMSIVALWMLAKKHVEQWFAWIIIDALSSGLYFYKEIYFTAVLYAVYTVVAVYGYKKWDLMEKTQYIDNGNNDNI